MMILDREIFNDDDDDDNDDNNKGSSVTVVDTSKDGKGYCYHYCSCTKNTTQPVLVYMSLIFMKRITLKSITESTTIVTKNRYGWY